MESALRPNRPSSSVAKQPPSAISTLLGFHHLARRFPFLYNPKFSSPPVVGLPADRVWKGLARYRITDEHTAKATHRENREYAKVTTLLDTPALDLTYYSDAPGGFATIHIQSVLTWLRTRTCASQHVQGNRI
jgi:hypothetical protein